MAGEVVFTVLKNNVTQIGTLTFSPGNTEGVFESDTAQTFAAGDVLSIVSPMVSDGSLADLTWTIQLGTATGTGATFSTGAPTPMRVSPSPITAAGHNQENAAPLSDNYDFYDVATVPSGAGVRLLRQTSGVIGQWRAIRCNAGTADDCLVYPPVGGRINDEIMNQAILVMRGTTLLLANTSTVDWITVP
jgi:hypothetical protein